METFHKLHPMKTIKNFGIDLFATALWAIAISMITLPNQFAPGGATGITVILNYLTGTPIGMMSFFINLPLLVWAWKLLGRNFVLQTLMTIVTFSLMVDYAIPLFPAIPAYTSDPLMAAIIAGVLNGLGTGLVFMHGSSGGGIDLLIKIVKRIYPHLSVGQIVLTINGIIMAFASFVYGSFNALVYGLVMTFASSQVVDLILNGIASANSITIMTKNPQEIGDAIIQQLHRSATVVNGEGAYSHGEISVMFCIVRKHEQQKLRELVKKADPHAFLIVQEAKQVFGGSFISQDGTT
ncbi:MAG: YitT family protein [Eubacteriales bacterium]